MTSCLESNLDDLPNYGDAEIINANFEYRDSINVYGSGQSKITNLTTKSAIDSENATITVDISVPAVSATLTAAEREEISLNNIVGYIDISTAAKVKIASIPLGSISDFSSKTATYTIMAADGTTKDWTLIINSFTK